MGIKDPSKDKLLPEKSDPTRPTLVINFEDFLVNKSESREGLRIRPNVTQFLEKASQFYEVVIVSDSYSSVIA